MGDPFDVAGGEVDLLVIIAQDLSRREIEFVGTVLRITLKSYPS